MTGKARLKENAVNLPIQHRQKMMEETHFGQASILTLRLARLESALNYRHGRRDHPLELA